MSLVDRLLAIEDTMMARIARDAKVPVLIGRHVRISDLKPPLVWVYPEEVPIDDGRLGFTEMWDLQYWVIAVVREVKDPVQGRREAMTLAAKASGAILKDNAGNWDRHLNTLVELVSRNGWSPADVRVSDTDGSLVGAAMRIKLRITNGEVC